MRGKRKVLAGVVALALTGGAAIWSGWISPLATVGAGLGLLYGLDRPDLSDPAMIRRGAAHYDLVCARCHGNPDRPDRGRHLHLSPPAPTLHLRLDGWPPEQLFRVVRDGFRNSAMPAWPAPGRDGEVWAVVGFLVALPAMDAARYRHVAGRVPAGTDPLIARCAACHGTTTPARADIPRLAGRMRPILCSNCAFSRTRTA